ncbi:MAG: helix-turn-helix transcriptional regulator, partial [Symbiobacteriaceae bacterium]|nr:helix-turn-helix transcriptional regulator [Symbiobacteriaceae bacterium]
RSPAAHDSELASALDSLGRVYLGTQRLDSSEEVLLEAMAIREQMALRNPQNPDMESIAAPYSLCQLYIAAAKHQAASLACQEALAYYESYAATIPTCADYAERTRHLIANLDARQPAPPDSTFTDEEREITMLLTEGFSQREIARKLHLTSHDVSRRVHAIREKVVVLSGSDDLVSDIAQKYKLTRREADMLRYLLKNAGNDIISAELYLSDETVRIHIRNLLRKLSIERRQDVTAWVESYQNRE